MKISEDIIADDAEQYCTLTAISNRFFKVIIMHELLGNNQKQCAGKPNDWGKKDP